MEFQANTENKTTPTLHVDDIFGTWRFIYNIAVSDLIRMGVLDKYGRLSIERDFILEKVNSFYKLDSAKNTIGETLFNGIVENQRGIKLPEWTRLYPPAILGIPLYQIGEELSPNNKIKFPYQRLGNHDIDIQIHMKWLLNYVINISVFSYTAEQKISRNGIQIQMLNRFDNIVKVVIKSNTNRMDQFLDNLCDEMANNMTFIIGKSKKLTESHKLLCSIVINNEEEENKC